MAHSDHFTCHSMNSPCCMYSIHTIHPQMVNLYKDPKGETIFPISNPTNPPQQSSNQQGYSIQTVKNLKTRIAELEAAISEKNKVCLDVHHSLTSTL